MACYHPLKFYKFENYENTGKTKMIFCKNENAKGENVVDVPCGQCIGCRLDYSRQWADRCMLEAKNYTDNYMITLTYDDFNVPKNLRANLDTGELDTVLTLKPDDLTKFLKDLRAYYKYHFNHENIRFYGCGEYGDVTKRPHYHVILFNLPIYDLVPYSINELGQRTFISDTIRSIWKKGQINIASVTWNSCAYVARYVMKKQKGKDAKKYYDNLKIEPEFVRMSRRPGIGKDFYDNNKDYIYKYDSITYRNYLDKPLTSTPPKYFDRLLKSEEPEKLEKVKKVRRFIAESNVDTLLKISKQSIYKLLEDKEKAKILQTVVFKRKNA